MTGTTIGDDGRASGGAEVNGRPFFARVESLRGLGALAVAGFHISGWGLHGRPLLPWETWPSQGPISNAVGKVLTWLLPGHAALMMFFVISGLVLQTSLQFGPQAPAAATLRFFMARVFRIFPIVIVASLVYAWLNGWQIPATPRTPAMPLDWTSLIRNFFLIDTTLNSTLWALQVEVLMVPVILLVYFIQRRYGSGPVLVLALATTVLSFAPGWAIFPPLSRNFFAFLLGMLLPKLASRYVASMSRSSARLLAMLCGFGLFLPAPLFGVYSQFSAVTEAYLAAIFLALVIYRTDLAGWCWLDSSPARHLGAASGSYYVLHMATIPSVISLAHWAIPAAWAHAAPAPMGLLVIVVWLFAVIPVAQVSYRIIEKPGIAIGRGIVR